MKLNPKLWHLILFVAILGVSLACAASAATIVFSHPPSPAGGVISSSWVDPNGSDADMYCYDDFTIPSNLDITEIHWRGGYAYGAPYGRVFNFSVTFYASIAGGSQPDCGNPQLPEHYLAYYEIGGIAGETYAGTVGGIAMYDYAYVLPHAFHATANTKYWVRIEGYQGTYPDWGIAVGTGGDGQHFEFSTGAAMFYFGQGDAAFDLLANISDAPPVEPVETRRLAVWPNPTRGATGLSFELPAPSIVRLAVYDPSGRRVRDLLVREMTQGSHRGIWDGNDERGASVPEGIYYIRLETPGETESRKVVITR
jgi:hypothetical protein